jgi:CRP/FNR family transcriptional regulator
MKCSTCVLKNNCLPQGLNDADVIKFEKLTEEKIVLEKDETLFKGGETADNIYVVKFGLLKTTLFENNKLSITGAFVSGMIIALPSFAQENYMGSAVSIDHSVSCKINKNELRELFVSVPNLAHTFLIKMSAFMHYYQVRLRLMGQPCKQRVASVYLLMSDMYKKNGFSGESFLIPLNGVELANYVGMSHETLSRMNKDLQDSGIIEIKQRHLTIHKHNALQDIADLTF